MNCNYKVKIKDIQNKYQFKIFCKTYDDTEIQGDIETLNSDVEALQEENLYLKSLVEQAFDKKEVEGEELSINDTINAKMEVGLFGNTKQETTTGKNKLRYPYNETTKTQNGITFTDNLNGSITINGTSTSATYFNFRANTTEDRQKLSSGTYTFSVAQALPNGVSLSIGFRDSEGNPISGLSTITLSTNTRTATVTINQAVEIFGFISISSGVTISNYIVKLQLEEGSTASSYEKYTGGIPAPNPDYPQEVNVVTGDNTIVVSNKNKFIGNDIHSGFIVATIGNPVTYLTSSLTNTYQKCCYVKAGQQYTLSRNVNTPASTNLRTSVICDDNDIIIERLDFNSTSNSISFVPNKTGWLYLTSDINATNIQIEKSSTATSFVEHQEQTFQVNLGSIELNGIGDYKDYFFKNGDKWYKKEYIGKVVLDGTENFTSAGTSGTDYRYNKTLSSLNIPNATTNNALCMANYFENVTIKTDKKWGAFYINGNLLVFYDKDNNFENATAFNTWLSNNNTTIYYVLATPTNIEITDTTLIEQLEELKTAMSYAGQTNISQINDDIPFILKITALASYNSRIVALENAILNANRSTPVKNTRKSNEVIEEPKEEVVDDNKDENIIKEEK